MTKKIYKNRTVNSRMTRMLTFVVALVTCCVMMAPRASATTCAGAAVIPAAPTLPYVSALTCGAANDMTSANTTTCGNSSYKGGLESVYVWTPTASYTSVSIAYTGVTYVGIFLYNGCPTSGGTCVGNITTSGASKTLTGMAVTGGTTYYIVFDTWPTPNSPCPGTMTLNGTISLPCSTPAPGNTVSSANPACSGVSFTLSLQNATPGTGVTYQWQSADDNAFTLNATNMGTASTQATSQTAAKYYRCVVTCSNGPSSGTSTPINVTMNAPANCYCTPQHSTGGTGDNISGVSITPGAVLSTGTGQGLYTYTPTPVVNLDKSSTYSLVITVGTDGTQHYGAWIDYDQSGTFDASEVLFVSTTALGGSATGTIIFTVPNTATSGNTRIRVRGGDDSPFTAAQACDASNSGYGEFEDYLVNIVSASACTTPAPGNTISSANPVCSGSSFNLSLQNATLGSVVTYQWQSADDNAFTVNVANLGTSSTQTTSQTSAKYYRCEVTCSTGPSTGTSTPVYVTMNIIDNCYCTNAGGSSSYYISNVTITGGVTNFNNASVGSATGYSNYTSTISTSQYLGSSINFSVTIGTPTMGLGIWIDFNHNGSFADVGEQVYISAAYVSTASGSIAVPPGAVVGNTRMRVVANYLATSPTACVGSSYTECEDYNFDVLPLLPCVTPAPGNTLPVNPSVCAGGTVNLSIQNATTGTGVTYQWYNSVGAIGGATSETYTTPALFAAETYHCDVTCSTGPSTVSSNSTTVSIAAAPVGGTATGPSTGVTYANLSYSVTGTTGGLQWQYSTTAVGGPFTDIPAATTSSLNITANGGGTYYVRCKAFNAGCTDDFSNVITTVVSVAGDNRCSANVITLGTNGPYTNVGATNDPTDPAVPGTTCSSQTGWCTFELTTNSSVWSTFTPAVSGKYSFRLDPTRNLFDTQFALFSGTSCAGPFTLIAANDDSSSSPFNSYIEPVCLNGGQTYYFLVDGYSTTTNNNWGILITKSANVAPVISACPANITQCDNGVATWTDPTATDDCGGATVTCSPASGSTFALGTTSVTCTATDAEAATSTCSFNVTINASPVISACPSNITQCDNAVATWTNPTATGTPAAPVVCSPASGSSFALGTTTVTCTATNSCGASSCSFDVTINASPVISACPSNITQCGSPIVTWTNPTATGTPAAPVVCSPASGSSFASGTTTVTCTATNTCGTSSCSFDVTYSAALPIGGITITSIPVSACTGNVVTVTTNVVPGALSYNWSAPAGCLINGLSSPQTTASNSVNITIGAIPGNSSGWEICVFASNTCGSTGTKCSWIRGALSTPAQIAGSTIACSSTSDSYSTTAVVGASSYVWSITGDATVSGTGITASVNFGPSFTSGQLCVRALLPCGYQSAQRCLTIANSTPQLGNMAGTFTVCPGATGLSYSVLPSVGASNYTWTPPAGATIATGAGTNAITLDFGPGYNGGNICVVATSVCGANSIQRCRTISSDKPNTPGNIVGQTTGICGQTVTYSVPAVSGATSYTWSITGATFGTSNGLNTIDVVYPSNFTTGTLCVTANNGCGSSTSRCVLAKGIPANPSAISGPAVVCANDAGIVYSVTSLFGASGYVWAVPAGASIVSGQGTTSIVVDFGATTGSILVTATSACGNSGTTTKAITMNCKMSSGILPGTSVNAYPNPVSTTLNVELDAMSAGVYSIELMDVSGRVVYVTSITAVSGFNNSSIDVAKFAKGVYTLSVKNADGFAKQIRVAVQ